MRHLSPVVGLGAILLLSGCADSKWTLFRPSQANVHLPVEKPPTADQLVAYINSNAQKFQSLECLDLDLDCKQGYQEFHIRGKLACQKPKNFRMYAEALGKTEADIGSNEKEFWYWIARGDPYLVHCSYQDLLNGVRIPFPFQPEWVMEALGMSEYGSTQGYEVLQRDKTYHLVQSTVNSQGKPVRKITVFNQLRARVQLTDHILQDANGHEICRAQITDVQDLRDSAGASARCPQRIVFTYPAERLVLKMRLGHRADDVRLNQLDPQRATGLFTRPALSGVPSYDLARGPEGLNPIRPAGGY